MYLITFATVRLQCEPATRNVCRKTSFKYCQKAKSAYEPCGPSAGAYPGFCSIKRLGIFLLPLDGMLVHRRVTPSIKFAGTHLYTWVERGAVRVKCLAQEHNAVSLERVRTRTAQSGVERTIHKATAPQAEVSTTQGDPKQFPAISKTVIRLQLRVFLAGNTVAMFCH